MILQKCCHDMDIMLWLADSKCESLSSFGELSLFYRGKMHRKELLLIVWMDAHIEMNVLSMHHAFIWRSCLRWLSGTCSDRSDRSEHVLEALKKKDLTEDVYSTVIIQ